MAILNENNNDNQQTIGKYTYQSSTPGDAVGDTRFYNNASNELVFEVCTVLNATKGSGTWEQMSIDVLKFDTSSSTTPNEGEINWNSTDGTLQIGMGGGVILQIGEEILLPKGKATGSAIDNGELVYVSGASGSKPELTLAKADAENTAVGTIAMATEDILQNANGFFTTFGLVRDVNTDPGTYTAGDALYLSSATAGAYTNVKPSLPNYAIKIGYVIVAHATEGVILVNIQNLTVDSENIKYNITTVNAATYDLLIDDYILNVTYTATGAVTSLTLPTAQTVTGRVIIVNDAGGKASENNITIDTEGSEKINGQDTFIINSDYQSIELYSDGSNWFCKSNFETKNTGSMYLYDASQTITINTQNEYHAIIGLLEGSNNSEGFTYLASSTGSITSTANNGGILRCTDVGHGLTTGQIITLNGMGDAAHNGITYITKIDDDTFDCDDITYNSASDTGSWQRGASLTCNSGYGGCYNISHNLSGESAVATKDYKTEIYINTTAQDEFAAESLFNNTGMNNLSGNGCALINSGDIIWFAINNTTDTTNLVIKHSNIHITK